MLNDLKNKLQNEGIKFADRGNTIAIMLKNDNLYLFSQGDGCIYCDPDDDTTYVSGIDGIATDINKIVQGIKNNI